MSDHCWAMSQTPLPDCGVDSRTSSRRSLARGESKVLGHDLQRIAMGPKGVCEMGRIDLRLKGYGCEASRRLDANSDDAGNPFQVALDSNSATVAMHSADGRMKDRGWR